MPDTPFATEEKHKENKQLDNNYFSAGQLSQAPELRDPSQHPLPPWPSQLQGEMVFRLWIDKRGRVQQVQAMTGDLPPAFVKTMRRYYLGLEFTAGYRPGGSVNSMIDITLLATRSE